MSTQIQGTLPYIVPQDARAVVISGCGTAKIGCSVTDADGRRVCRRRETCVTDAFEAQTMWVNMLMTTPMCTVAPP